MRIAFLLQSFPTVSETFILSQVTGLIDLGHDVQVFAERRPEHTQTDEPIHPDFQSYNLASRTTYLDSEMPAESGYWSMPVWPFSGETWLPGAERGIPNSARLLQAVPALRRCLDVAPELTLEVIDPEQYGSQAVSLEALYHLASFLARSHQIDALHAHFGPVANNFRFARNVCQAPLVVTFHGYDFSQYPQEHGDQVYRQLFQEADAVMGISQYAVGRLMKLGCPEEKLSVHHTGVYPDRFPFCARRLEAGEPVRILTVGRLVEKKGLEYALRAVAEARHSHPNLRYEIIGEGPLRSELEDLIRRLELNSIVTLHGAAGADAVRRSFAEAHLYLLPSVTARDGDQEGIPVSLMEAQSCGLPILSTFHSGIPELVADGRSGLLVEERNVEQLARALLQMVQNPQAWPSMGQCGRKLVEARFDTAQLNRDLLKIYEKAISRFASARRK
jgi:colanic acid/amylovoran biosynthesis glycosyltransferase